MDHILLYSSSIKRTNQHSQSILKPSSREAFPREQSQSFCFDSLVNPPNDLYSDNAPSKPSHLVSSRCTISAIRITRDKHQVEPLLGNEEMCLSSRRPSNLARRNHYISNRLVRVRVGSSGNVQLACRCQSDLLDSMQ